MKYRMMVCCECGKSILRSSGTQKRCKDCRKAYTKAHDKERNNIQYRKELRRGYVKAYYQTPKGKADRNAYGKARSQTSEYKAYQKEYRQTLGCKAKEKAREHTPACRARRKACVQSKKSTKNIFNLISLNTALQERSVA